MEQFQLTLYPSWDVQKPTIPPRSRFYHLEPIGVGTPYTESLTSYLIRLAQEHCVNVSQVLLTEIAPLIRREKGLSFAQFESISKVCGIDRDRTAINGMGLTATHLVMALEALTSQKDLRFLTLLPLAEIVSKRSLLRPIRAWCPICYQEWLNTEQTIYEPLLWSIKIIEFCPSHHHPLLSKCPYCHQQQLVLCRNSRPGYCNKCGHWLGKRSSKKAVAGLREGETFDNHFSYILNNVGELITLASGHDLPIEGYKLQQIFSRYIHQVYGGNVTALSRFVGIHVATLSCWYQGATLPQLDKLLQFTERLQISLVDFLTEEFLADDGLNQSVILPSPASQTRKHLRRLDLEKLQVIQLVLQQVLQESPPPSLQDVARRLNYRSLVLQYHFPNLCSQIQLNHAAYRKLERQQRIQPVLEAALEELPPPSLLEVVRRLGYKNNSYLYTYFPSLSRQIARRYKDYVQACGLQERNRIFQEIQTIALQIHSQGYQPTRCRVAELLQKPGVMLNRYAQDVLRQVQRSLGYE
jgi:transcriptional regulator with XRE-family HTH domain